ncbi:MAG: sulfite exporter TauE/SafE family protein [Anaerolineaceae bacterium]|nr:sulfite exporter TauE/SafE family protein [Anaerolineaceae bacterium]
MDYHIFLYVLVGFVAQMIDGALGMAYGVSSTSFLLSVGVSPAAASASVHMAEVFTTLVSGASHWKLGNVNKELVKRLAIPGVLGGIAGAYLLVNLPGNQLKPFVAIYLLIMGIRILIKAIRFKHHVQRDQIPGKIQMSILGLFGGFFDAIGGGGWGPIVTTTLVSNGNSPRESIGSVNLTEFFVTFAEALTFIATLGLASWKVIIGLIVGGVVAAPLGAWMTRKIHVRAMMFIVSAVIIFLQVRTILESWVY